MSLAGSLAGQKFEICTVDSSLTTVFKPLRQSKDKKVTGEAQLMSFDS